MLVHRRDLDRHIRSRHPDVAPPPSTTSLADDEEDEEEAVEDEEVLDVGMESDSAELPSPAHDDGDRWFARNVVIFIFYNQGWIDI